MSCSSTTRHWFGPGCQVSALFGPRTTYLYACALSTLSITGGLRHTSPGLQAIGTARSRRQLPSAAELPTTAIRLPNGTCFLTAKATGTSGGGIVASSSGALLPRAVADRVTRRRACLGFPVGGVSNRLASASASATARVSTSLSNAASSLSCSGDATCGFTSGVSLALSSTAFAASMALVLAVVRVSALWCCRSTSRGRTCIKRRGGRRLRLECNCRPRHSLLLLAPLGRLYTQRWREAPAACDARDAPHGETSDCLVPRGDLEVLLHRIAFT